MNKTFKLFWNILLLLILILFSCNSSDSPLSPQNTEYDWEGEVGKFNELYRDSILFNSDRHLGTSFAPSVHIMFKDGTGMHAKTNEWFTFAAIWSPRKWKIFYVADTSFNKPARGLFIMNADGTNISRITPMNEDIWGVSCAPDGKKIAYIVLNDNGEGKIRVANPDGSEAKDITGYFGAHTFHTLSWSNDSRRIAFDGANTGIGVVDADGSNYQSLFSYNYQCWDPSWSPDGKKLAFASFAKIDSIHYSQIFYYDIVSHGIHQITNSKEFSGAPCWSRDSQKLIFSSRLPGNSPNHLFMVNHDGTQLKQLTHGTGSDWRPCW